MTRLAILPASVIIHLTQDDQ